MSEECFSAAITREGNLLRIALPRVFDRKNAAEIEKEIREKIDGEITALLFDASELRFVSADGLDVILDLKKEYRDISIDHARIGICDTLSSFGFDRFLNITKQYRFVSVKDCTVIGQGGHGTIYRLGEDTIVKVYRDRSPLSIIENEREYARNAFVSGIPTAIAYDVVETEEGYGVIFEMINGMTLGRYLSRHPEKLEEYGVKFADLLLSLHTTDASPDLYPDFHEVYLDRFEKAKEFLSEKDAEKLKDVIRAIPRGKGMVHGDYHPNNVMIDDEGELLLIDMADISRGNGFFDMGGSYMLMYVLAGVPILRMIIQKITSLSPKDSRRMWTILMRRYFGTEEKEKLKAIEKTYRAFSNIRIAGSLGMKSSRPEIITKLMKVYTKAFVVPKTEKYVRLFSSLAE